MAWLSGSWRNLDATIFVGMPVQCEWMGGMSATEPRSSASARKASRVCGPPLMLAHFTSNVKEFARPENSIAF